MKSAGNNAPVFALDEDTLWSDLEDAMAGAAQYQADTLGIIRPLMFFAPMTAPWNPDAWVPMKTMPLNLLIVSMERTADEVVREALRQAEAALGGTRLAGGFAALPPINFDEDAVAEIYTRMEEAEGLRFHGHEHTGEDEASFYFVRGGAAVRAFDKALRKVTAGTHG